MSARTWIPNQHGAWAFLITPVIYALTVAGPKFVQVLLLIAWLSAYSFNFYFGITVKSRKLSKYRKQLIYYGLVASLIGLYLIVKFPKILLAAPILLVGFLINALFVSNRNERSVFNDLVGILLSFVVGIAALYVGSRQIKGEWVSALFLIAIYFSGTVFYVKTIIREKGKKVWLYLSYLWHFVATLVAFGMKFNVGWLFALMLIRAFYIPTRNLKPKQVGLIEIGFTIALYLALLR